MLFFRTESIEIVVALAAVLVGGGISAIVASRRSQRTIRAAIQEASAIVSEGLAAADNDAAINQVTERLARFLDADACAIALPTEDGLLGVGASYGYPHPERLFIGQDEGMTGLAFSSGAPVIAADVSKEPSYVATIEGVRSAVALPMRYEGRMVGAFDVESRRRIYKESDLAIMLPLADQIAAVISSRALRSEAQERAAAEQKDRKEVQAISAVVMAGVAAAGELDIALDSMITEISVQMGWESMALILFEDDGLLHTRAYYGYPEFSTKIAWQPGQGIVGSVGGSGVARLIGDVRADPDYWDIVSTTRSEMCVALRADGRVLGVLNAESPESDFFSEDDFRLLTTLADQMAIVIERARLADLERAALERLRELDQLKDDFVATVSHELRTPLTSINGYAQTLAIRGSELTPVERSAFLDVIVRQCKRLSTIVESLLLVSRLESDEMRYKPTYVLVRDLIAEAAEAAGTGGRVVAEIQDGTGVISDQFRLHHIMRNLIENACKYSPDGEAVLVRAANIDDHLRVEVLDRGPGIPDDKRAVVFERFRRLGDPGATGAPGTGLGLYIAQRFARDLGGTIAVDGGVDPEWPGACFTVDVVGASSDVELKLSETH